MATIGTLMIELSANVARLEHDLGKAERHVRNTERMMQLSVNRMNGFFSLMGGSLSVVAMVGFVKSGIDAQDMLATLSEKTGTSVRDLAGLKYAAEQNSTSLEAVANAGKKLATSMTDKPALFRNMGITAKTSTDAMIQMADVFSNMPDGVEKTALAVKLMGKNGEDMIPFLNQGSDSLRKLIDAGKAMSPATDESAARAKEFNDQLNTLSTSAHGFAVEAANYVLPNLVKISTAMSDTARDSGPFKAMLVGLGGVFSAVFTDDLLDREQKIVKKMDYLRGEMSSNIDWGTGFGLVGMGDQTKKEVDAISAELVILEKELEGLRKQRADAEKEKGEAEKRAEEIQKKRLARLKFLQEIDEKEKNLQKGGATASGLSVDFKTDLSKKYRDINSTTMSATDKQHADNMAAVEQRTARAREELDKLNLSTKDRKLFLDEVNNAEERQKQQMEALHGIILQNNASWTHGARIAMRSYLDEVNNVAKQTQVLFGDAFKNMEDALVSFVRTGKLDFQSLTDSIINNMIRMQIQQSVTGPLSNMLNNLLGIPGTQPPAPIVDIRPNALGNVFPFANGGAFTNGLFNRPTPFAFASGGGFNLGVMGEAGPEAVMPLSRGADGKLGVRAQGGGGNNIYITDNTVINMNGDNGSAPSVRDVERIIDAKQAKLVDRLQRQGAI